MCTCPHIYKASVDIIIAKKNHKSKRMGLERWAVGGGARVARGSLTHSLCLSFLCLCVCVCGAAVSRGEQDAGGTRESSIITHDHCCGINYTRTCWTA